MSVLGRRRIGRDSGDSTSPASVTQKETVENQVLLGNLQGRAAASLFFNLFFWRHWVLAAAGGLSLVTDSNLLVTFVAVRGPLVVVASPAAEHRALGTRASAVVAHWLSSTGFVVEAPGFSYPMPWGISLDQGLNPCVLHWQADSHPLSP